jgi:DNA polymerase III delta subunit
MVFACIANFDSTLKTAKSVAKLARLEKFEKKKYYAGAANKEIVTWANKEAHRFGAFIEDDAVFYLAESCECNLRQMSAEISKAATFILPDKTIKLSHVKVLSPHFSQIFALLEHWAYKRKQQVLESLDELRARQISAHIIIATLQTTLSKWVSYRTEMDKATPAGGPSRGRDLPMHELARQIAFDPRSAFVVEQDLKRIRGLSLAYLIDKKKELTELEMAVKTGQLPEQHALAMFFTR